MEDDIFYFFVNYYSTIVPALAHDETDDHFKKFHLLLEDLKNEYELKIIDRKTLYNKLLNNITEDDKEYTGCHQMVKRLKEWSNE